MIVLKPYLKLRRPGYSWAAREVMFYGLAVAICGVGFLVAGSITVLLSPDHVGRAVPPPSSGKVTPLTPLSPGLSSDRVAPAQSSTDNIEQVADMMVRLCLAGGRTQTVGGSGTGRADLALRSLDVRGNLTGEFRISSSSAEGLVNGIDNALTQVAADQADKVRICLQPVRERLLDVLLPLPLPRTSYDSFQMKIISDCENAHQSLAGCRCLADRIPNIFGPDLYKMVLWQTLHGSEGAKAEAIKEWGIVTAQRLSQALTSDIDRYRANAHVEASSCGMNDYYPR